ncbi:MAG TPA: hypothetical protein VHX86_04375 [Tepidisphaeraceae bacterium]|nr:hypothetical protein [Tepidisphaeraceae bacterium]
MSAFTFHIFGILAILALAWVLFFVWLVGMIFRGMWLGFAHLTGISGRPPRLAARPRRCNRLRCLTVNPPQANFCRRCGSSLTRSTVGPQTSACGDSRRWISSSSRL